MTDDQLKEIVSRLWNEKYNGNPSYRVSLFKKAAEEVLLSAMKEAMRLEVESHNKAMCNVICEATDTNDFANLPITIGEIRDMIKVYKDRETEKVSIEFTRWLMGRIDEIHFASKDGLWEVMKPTLERRGEPEYKTDAQLFNEYLNQSK